MLGVATRPSQGSAFELCEVIVAAGQSHGDEKLPLRRPEWDYHTRYTVTGGIEVLKRCRVCLRLLFLKTWKAKYGSALIGREGNSRP